MTQKTRVHHAIAADGEPKGAGTFPEATEVRNASEAKKPGRARKTGKYGRVPAGSPRAGINITPEILEQICCIADRYYYFISNYSVAELYRHYLYRHCSQSTMSEYGVALVTLDEKHITYAQFNYALKKLQRNGAIPPKQVGKLSLSRRGMFAKRERRDADS